MTQLLNDSLQDFLPHPHPPDIPQTHRLGVKTHTTALSSLKPFSLLEIHAPLGVLRAGNRLGAFVCSNHSSDGARAARRHRRHVHAHSALWWKVWRTPPEQQGQLQVRRLWSRKRVPHTNTHKRKPRAVATWQQRRSAEDRGPEPTHSRCGGATLRRCK